MSNQTLVLYNTNFANKIKAECINAIYELEKKIAWKKTNLQRQDLACYQAVLSFLKVQIQKPDHTYKEIAKQIAEYYDYCLYISKKIVIWERQ